jgi:hypothetical protein
MSIIPPRRVNPANPLDSSRGIRAARVGMPVRYRYKPPQQTDDDYHWRSHDDEWERIKDLLPGREGQ